jgi:hypothetical protein
MPFTLIQGTFHLVNHTALGNETGFEPDGDSIHFRPADPKLLDRLTKLRRPYTLTRIGSVQLRFEGLDALELHYRAATGGPESFQPRSLSEAARDFLTGALDMDPVPYSPPRNVRVKPPVPHDATPGYILARSLEVNGRPVSFAFKGAPPLPDGSAVELKQSLLRKSLNYQLVRAGQAYPLFYDTLFYDLRETLMAAAQEARVKKRGLWAADRSRRGLTVNNQLSLETNGVIFPKLFRRLTDFLATGGNLTSFLPWLEAKREQVIDLDHCHFTHFDNIVNVTGNVVKLTKLADRIVFVSEK